MHQDSRDKIPVRKLTPSPTLPRKRGRGHTAFAAQLSPAGLTRGSIILRKKFLRRRWMPGSSPGMTDKRPQVKTLI